MPSATPVAPFPPNAAEPAIWAIFAWMEELSTGEVGLLIGDNQEARDMFVAKFHPSSRRPRVLENHVKALFEIIDLYNR